MTGYVCCSGDCWVRPLSVRPKHGMCVVPWGASYECIALWDPPQLHGPARKTHAARRTHAAMHAPGTPHLGGRDPVCWISWINRWCACADEKTGRTAKNWNIFSECSMFISGVLMCLLYQGVYLDNRATAIIAAILPLLALYRTFFKDMRGEPARLLQAHHEVNVPANAPAQPHAGLESRSYQQCPSPFTPRAGPLPR